MDDYISSMFEWLHQVWRGQGIIYHERYSILMRDIRHSTYIESIQARVTHRFGIDDFGAIIDSCTEVFRIAAINKANGDTKFRQRIVEEIICAAIETGRRYDLVAQSGNIQNRQCFRRLSGCRGQRTNASFKSRYTALKSVLGRVHNACIDVTKLFQGKEICCMFWTIKDI